MEKKLLILGSDCGSVDVARRAKEKGLYVIVSDLMETSPTKEIADEAWLISTTDIDALAGKCRAEGVSAVITGASDFNIGNSRKLCKELGLPVYCSNDYAWEVANNKRLFKDECKRADVRVAEDYYLTDELSPEELSRIKYPVVVKPVDKCGNLGMSYCSNEQDLVAAYRKARSVSENATIVVERQLHGPEFYINYVVADGKACIYFFTSEHNQPGYPANLYSLIFTNSAHLSQWLEEMNDKVIEVFERIGLTEGQAWVETILDEDGQFYLLEMGYRWGGEMLYVPYERISGFDSLSWMIECAFGEKHTEDDLPGMVTQPCESVAAAYYLFVENSGTIARCEGIDELEASPNIYVDIPKRGGGLHQRWYIIRACSGVRREHREAVRDPRLDQRDASNRERIGTGYDSPIYRPRSSSSQVSQGNKRVRKVTTDTSDSIETERVPKGFFRTANLAVKRLFDIIVSLIGLIVLSPLLLILAIAVRLSSPGPAIFRQERLGKNGRVFRIAKFRTMVLNAENIGLGLQLTSADDPRITKIGRIMRSARLDELPQLWNVLVGEMSLVGPRPPATYWPYDGYENYPSWAKRRFSMRPGMTGLVQISHEVSTSPWDERIVVDNEYVDNFSILLDIRILALTVKTVFKREAI